MGTGLTVLGVRKRNEKRPSGEQYAESELNRRGL